MYRKSLSGNSLTVAGQLVTDVKTVTASLSGVAYSSMKVHREADGGTILSGGTP